MSALRVFLIQVRALTIANLKARYRKTWAGFLWVVLNPLITYGIQAFVFSTVLRIQVEGYLLFLVSGLLPWLFINQSLEMCTSIFVVSGPLLKSYTVHPLVYLLAQILDNLLNFISSFALILLVLWSIFPWKLPQLLLLPLPVAVLCVGVFSLAWIMATVQVFFRDSKFMLSFAMSITFFITPIFFPFSFIPPEYQWIGHFNPFYRLILPFQTLLYDYNLPRFWHSTGIGALTAVTFLAIASLLWSRKRNLVYFYV